MTNEGWTEYTGQDIPVGAIVETRWPDWHDLDDHGLFRGGDLTLRLADSSRYFSHRGRMEFRELIQLHEAEQAIREAWNYGFAKGALDDQAEYRSAKEFLAAWRERRKG